MKIHRSFLGLTALVALSALLCLPATASVSPAGFDSVVVQASTFEPASVVLEVTGTTAEQIDTNVDKIQLDQAAPVGGVLLAPGILCPRSPRLLCAAPTASDILTEEAERQDLT